MTKISQDDIARLANLSSLSLSREETEKLQIEIETILDYIKSLDELDTEGVEPTYQVNSLQNVWREDEVDESNVGREILLSLAKATKDNQIQVPKVL